jgi:hypothetical protein
MLLHSASFGIQKGRRPSVHPFLLILIIGAILIGVLLIVYYRMGGRGTPTVNDPQRLNDEIRAELNRHPRSNLPRRW